MVCRAQEQKRRISLYTKILRVSIILISAPLFFGCATNYCPGDDSPAEGAIRYKLKFALSGPEESKYKKVRQKIRTNEDSLYHDAVVEYSSYETRYPFYLLGFEKPRDKNDIRPYCKRNEVDCQTPSFDPDNFRNGSRGVPDEIIATQEDINKNLFEDKRPIVLTHVLNVRKASPDSSGSEQKECFIFNVYGDETATPWCNHHYKAEVGKPEWKREGWKGLDQLATDIKERAAAEKATHIILLATGWNTRQYESYLDFRAWMKNLQDDFTAKKEAFRPIFIGTTWESEWPWWSNVPLLGSAVSEFNKGNDADEIGFTWENYVLNNLLKPVVRATGVQLVIIGHSFGSRIALGSHYVRDVLIRTTPVPDVPLTIIGMQAAFPVARFVSTEGKEHQYVASNKGSARIVITSSAYDEAAGKMCIFTKYVGAGCGLKELKNDQQYQQFVQVLRTTEKGQPQGEPDWSRVSVYDASQFVNCQLKGTSSGSHSDVYDAEMGHFLSEIIRASTTQ